MIVSIARPILAAALVLGIGTAFVSQASAQYSGSAVMTMNRETGVLRYYWSNGYSSVYGPPIQELRGGERPTEPNACDRQGRPAFEIVNPSAGEAVCGR